MARSYLPSKKTVNIRTGQLYALFDGEQHYQNLGWVENAKLAIDVSEEDVKAATGGTAYTVKTIVTEAGGTLTVTLLNSTARNLAMQAAGDVNVLTQSSATDVEITATDVIPGHLIDLGKIKVTALTATSGASTLIDGVDYILNGKAGTVEFLTAHATVEITFSAAAVTAADGIDWISILTRPAGVSATFLIVGEDDEGKSFRASGINAALRASGDMGLISSEVNKIEVTGKVYKGPDVSAPFGKVVELG